MVSERALATCGALLLIGCKGTANAELSISLPPTIVGDTTWIEIAAFTNSSCDALAETAFAIPKDAADSYILRKNDGTTTTLGPFQKGPLTFLAAAKDDACNILGTTCATVDLSDSTNISLSFSETLEPIATCAEGAACNHGACIASPAEKPVSGACSLALAGQGPLGTPFGLDKTLLGTPSITETDSGFLIAYREFDPAIGAARLTLYPIDKNGGALTATRSALPERCSLAAESDPVGIAWSGKKGLVGIARKACGTSAGGIDLFGVNAKGAIQSFVFNPTPDANIAIQLSASRALATNAPNAWIAFLEGTAARVADSTFEGVLSNGVTVASAARDAWIASSDSTGALLIAQANGTLTLSIGKTGTSPSDWVTTQTTPGDFGSVAVDGDQVAILAATAAGATLTTFDGESSGRSLSLASKGDLVGADMSVAENAAFVVTQEKRRLTLSVASPMSNPTWHDTFSFEDDSRIYLPSALRDGKVAIRTSHDRVAVVWATGNNVSYDEPIGGYVVFRCESR